MHRFILPFVLVAGLLSTGCVVTIKTAGPPCGETDPSCHNQQPLFSFEEDIAQLNVSDAVANSQQLGNALFDTDSALTYVANTSQLLVTVATDTGQTFSQTFSAAPVTGNGFSPAAPQTITHAFAPQNPQAISSFINSAVDNANSTVTIKIQMMARFQSPSDGNQHTVYGRTYAANYGTQSLGWSAYTAPTGTGGPQSGTTGIDPGGE